MSVRCAVVALDTARRNDLAAKSGSPAPSPTRIAAMPETLRWRIITEIEVQQRQHAEPSGLPGSSSLTASLSGHRVGRTDPSA